MMNEKYPLKIYEKPGFRSSSLVVGWTEDAGELGSKVIDYLNNKLGSQRFAEIEPEDFFPLGGVSIEDDIAQFPESRFYSCQEKILLTFKSNSPRFEWYRFLSSVLDMAEHCHVKELYTVGGMISSTVHTAPRELLAVANSPKMKKVLSEYNLATDMDYQTPPGQRPTLSSFLLWIAKRRNIASSSLWVPIPFYLVTVEDPRAWRKPLEFFDKRFSLGLDFRNIDKEIKRQDKKINELRLHLPEIDNYLYKLGQNLPLTEDENEKLVKEIEECLRKE